MQLHIAAKMLVLCCYMASANERFRFCQIT